MKYKCNFDTKRRWYHHGIMQRKLQALTLIVLSHQIFRIKVIFLMLDFDIFVILIYDSNFLPRPVMTWFKELSCCYSVISIILFYMHLNSKTRLSLHRPVFTRIGD